MNEKLLEQVSALADDELDVREAELLLGRMKRDRALRNAWARYHLVGEAMRGALPRVHQRDFSAAVAAVIENEELPRDDKGLAAISRSSAFRPVAGLAVAASVAMLAVLTLQLPQDRVPSEVIPRGVEVPLAVPRAQGQAVDFSGIRSAALQNQLRGYLLNHREHTSSPRIRGVMPYVQLAAHETRSVKVDVDEATLDETPDWQD